MTPQQLKAMKLALEALKGLYISNFTMPNSPINIAITAIEEALAEHAMRNVQRLGQEIEQCQCPECQIKPHASDCAVHSEPAYPKGKCDCGAQPEQEPVVYQCPRCATSMQVDLTAKAALAQPEQALCDLAEDGVCETLDCPNHPIEQEPVATVTSETGADITMSWWHEPPLPVGTKLYTSPPQRTWVGLTDEQANEYNYLGPDMYWVAQEIAAILKEKNT